MATIVRQPFAPLDGARLQTLTSLKNRQNALSTNAPVKRKASEVLDVDDFENVDPTLFSKRPKGASLDGFYQAKDQFKPSSFVLTKATSVPSLPKNLLSPTKPVASNASRPRAFLQPKSPAARLNTSISKPAPLSAPAGRSPTRGSKRIGILSNRRRTGGHFNRVEPPTFGLSAAAPFSLDAALKGTIPSYSGRSSGPGSADIASSLREPEMKSDWFFDIHEDTPEQEMTNLLQHGTCTLDISSDEESAVKARRERAEGRDKENIPPSDDVSQTRAAGARRAAAAAAAAGAVDEDQMAIEKIRGPLVEMNPADYYPEGCDDSSVIVIAEDNEVTTEVELSTETAPSFEEPACSAAAALEFSLTPEVKLDLDMAVEAKLDSGMTVDALMGKEDPATKAAVLEPMEGTGETFDLWESGSSKDETEVPARVATPSPDAGNAPQEER